MTKNSSIATSQEDVGDDEWHTQKKKTGPKKIDVGMKKKVGRSLERVLRHKSMAKEITNGRQLTLDEIHKNKKWSSFHGTYMN